jgi:uncharacterized protein YajQ (UPF0234 family)
MTGHEDLKKAIIGDFIKASTIKEDIDPAAAKSTSSAELAGELKGNGSLLEQVMANKEKPVVSMELSETKKVAAGMLDDNLRLLGKLL